VAFFRPAVRDLREELLAHIALLGETAAPSGREADRVQLWLERLNPDPGFQCHIDSFGNGVALLPGEEEAAPLLLLTHADGVIPEDDHPEITVRPEAIVGPFMGDNSPVLAAFAALPRLMERTGWRPRRPILLLAAVRMLGRADYEGLIRHLEAGAPPSAVVVESVELGRLNYTALGVRRCEVAVDLPESYDWMRFGATGAILPLNDIIQSIGQIPLPRRPLTAVVLGTIRGGVNDRQIAHEARLGFEVRSESADRLKEIETAVGDICAAVAGRHGVRVRFDVYARREPGDQDIGHPVVRAARGVLSALQLEPLLYPSTGMLSILLSRRIPAVTIGLARSHREPELEEIEEALDLESYLTGVTQLAALAAILSAEATHG